MVATGTAQIQISASTARLPAGLRAAMQMLQGFASNSARLMASVGAASLGHMRNPLAQMGAAAMHALTFRGLDVLVNQGKEVLDFNEQLMRLGVDIRKKPAEMEGIGHAIRKVSSDTGLSALEILKAGRAYVDLAGAESFTMDKVSLIGRAAQASGSDVGDMAKLMFTLTENMKVPPGELEDTIGGLINQAKSGTIHFRELAQELIALGPVYSQFGVSGREGANQLGALMQIAGHGFGSASEAATGLQRILRAIPQHFKNFDKYGVQIFKKGSMSELLPFKEIFANIRKSKLDLNRPELIKAFGRGEAERFYQLLKMCVGQYDELEAAGRRNGVVAEDLGTVTESSTGRIATAIEKMKNAIGEAFTPERVEHFAEIVEAAADKVETLVVLLEKTASVLGAIYDAGKWFGEKTGQNTNQNPFWFHEGHLTGIMDFANEQMALNEDFTYAKAHGITPQQARAVRIQNRDAYDEALKNFGEAEDEGKATAESKRRAVKAKYTPWTEAGAKGTRAAAEHYLDALHMKPSEEERIRQDIEKRQIEADIRAGKGRSLPERDVAAPLSTAIDQLLPPTNVRSQQETIDAFTQVITQSLAPQVSRAVTQGIEASSLGRGPIKATIDNPVDFDGRRGKP